MTTMLHKNVQVFGVKTLSDQGDGVVEAFVSGIGNKDSSGDIIMSGAYDDSLAVRKPKGVWAHNWDLPVSKTLEIYEVPAGDARLPAKMLLAGAGGLYVKTQFNLNTERGRDAYEDVKFFGDEGEWSIGYAEVEASFSKDLQANLLAKIDLYEYSFVLFGANNLTATASLKHLFEDVRNALEEKAEAKDERVAIDAAVLAKDLAELGRITKDSKWFDDDFWGDDWAEPEEEAPAGSIEAKLDSVEDVVEAMFPEDPNHFCSVVATFDTTVVVSHTGMQQVMDSNGEPVLANDYPVWESFESYYEQHNYSTDAAGVVTVDPVGVRVDLVQTVVPVGKGVLFEVMAKAIATLTGLDPAEMGMSTEETVEVTEEKTDEKTDDVETAEKADMPGDAKCVTCSHLGSAHKDVAAGDNSGACSMLNCDCKAMVTKSAETVDMDEKSMIAVDEEMLAMVAELEAAVK